MLNSVIFLKVFIASLGLLKYTKSLSHVSFSLLLAIFHIKFVVDDLKCQILLHRPFAGPFYMKYFCTFNYDE